MCGSVDETAASEARRDLAPRFPGGRASARVQSVCVAALRDVSTESARIHCGTGHYVLQYSCVENGLRSQILTTD